MKAKSYAINLRIFIGKNGQSFLGAPPLVPPRISPGIVSFLSTIKFSCIFLKKCFILYIL